ncbi:MAG: TldD/PmbA family protein [FCB group bacterium]|jgi:TldD protein
MIYNTRRDFLKNCGMGLGLAVTSNLFKGNLFAQSGPASQLSTENRYGITIEEMKKLLEIALSKGGDFSELYFEYSIANSVTMAEDIIKSSSENIRLGVGVRVLKGEQTGYGYTNDLTFEKIKAVALTAAAIANDNSQLSIANLNIAQPKLQVYDLSNPFYDKNLELKIDLIKEAYNTAKSYDNRITKVTTSLAEDIQYITIANSEGLLISDTRPQVRISTSSTAIEKGNRTTAYASGGGRIGVDFYKNVVTPAEIGKRASEEAIILLSAVNAPAGEQTVVLSSHQSGVMIHEAVGHPLEGDGIWKKSSIMWDKFGQEVANPIVTIYDDATIPNYRGSMNIDDEGTQTENVMLIEKGKLVGFMNDRLSAKILKQKPNGHGRRESYKCPPIPRMNNTILAKGDNSVDEIISSVKNGFYAKTYEGGMVSGTGKFTFSVNLGYLIENGKLTKPLKNATLIGQNTNILKDMEMISNDTAFFLGTCGKDGQSAAVTAGTPTLKIRKMTVGGKS